MRTRPGWVEPEVYFKTVHLAQNAISGAREDIYSEQTVEIALGPKGAFVNGNIVTLLRRALPDQAFRAILPVRCDPKLPKEPKTPRIVELLRKAVEMRALLESGKIANQVEIACREGVTRDRVTQILGLLRLAPEIQQQILSMPDTTRQRLITERVLRPIGTIPEHHNQISEF